MDADDSRSANSLPSLTRRLLSGDHDLMTLRRPLMYHLHLRRNLRSLGFLIVLCAIIGSSITLWWANRIGLPESWRSAIETELGKQGIQVQIGALSYIPLRGVAASHVRFYSDPERRHEVSRLERVLLNFDKTKLARGVVRITRIELRDAELILPVDPDHPDSEVLEITGANGTLLMPGYRRLEIRGAHGRIAGIDLTLDARFIGYQGQDDGPAEAREVGKRRKMIAKIVRELQRWDFDSASPPQLRVSMAGNTHESSSITAKFSLSVPQLEKNGHRLEDIRAEAEMTGNLLTVTSLHARDPRGSISGLIDYDISAREGRFDIDSSLEITPLLDAWAGTPLPAAISINGDQQISVQGEFRINSKNIPRIQVTGSTRCDAVMLRDMRFDSVACAFSWSEGELFLKDVHLSRPDGQATGKALIQWPLVRLSLHSTMPAEVYKPLFIGKPLEVVLNHFTERKKATFDVQLEGGFDATDRQSWAYTGSGTVTNVNYADVPVNSATCRFSLSHHELDFFDGTVSFNYQKYPLRRAYNGPAAGTATISRIRYESPEKLVHIENVTGDIWAAPLVRLFAPKVADSLEKYRFHRPPSLTGSGVVDVTPQGRTRLDVSFRSKESADYEFLGKNITLSQPVGKVIIHGPKVTVSDLQLNAFNGPVTAHFDFSKNGKLTGEMSWTKLAIPALASTYGFQMKGGLLTGRIDFSIINGLVETMEGDGLFALDKTELFSVPMFGPLSPLIGSVVGDRRAGFERAKSAFCTFKIRKGVLSTRDFQTDTTSLAFVGDGEVNLKTRTIDMTIRMNARGFLGLITLPLRPFYGMFQFRGIGPLNDTEWENVMFTAPPKEQEELLRAIPRATVISPPE